jgi:RES domain
MRRRLVRCVAALDFLEGSPPRYLYTSGRPGRCNPRDVDCLYFSETERVADLEYRRRFVGVGAATEPRLTFFAQVDLKHVVDLSRPAVLKALGISTDDMLETWRSALLPTRLQRLGLAVSGQRRVSAIRFASDACRRAGTKGWNVGIFPDAIVAPSQVRILGKSGASLEKLP